MNAFTNTQGQRQRRKHRIRTSLRGTSLRPRMSVFRSHRHISVQLIDDGAGKTLANVSDLELAQHPKRKQLSFRERAYWVGEQLAAKAKVKGIRQARFDRGQYRYHGIVAAVAEGARKGGLKM